MSAEGEINALIRECGDILSGDYGDKTDEHINNLMTEMEGFRFLLIATQSIKILNDKSLDGVRRVKGWLKANMAGLTSVPNTTKVSAHADANANASVSIEIKRTINTVQQCNELNPGERDAVELAIHRMEDAARDKDEKGFAEKLSDAIDIASKAAGLVPAVVKAAGTIAGLF